VPGGAPTVSPPPPALPVVDAGLRVADPPVAQGLFEGIVGGVTSVFFGS
jgi:hypothetical protein